MGILKILETRLFSVRVDISAFLFNTSSLCSLNYQELPDHFEENMQLWMDRFHQLLQLENQLVETDVDTEVGVLQLIKSQVCDNVALYAQKFDEDFKVCHYWNLS